MANTKIQWANKVWNPVTGCTPISSGCLNCYAKRMANRLRGRCGYPVDEPFKITLHSERLEEPFHWRKPCMIFVCSMGDLFHEDVPTMFIDRILGVISDCPQHIFLVLTKRPQNIEPKLYGGSEKHPFRYLGGGDYLSNLWIGVSVENQETVDERIPILLQIPVALRFVNVEPMLGPINLLQYLITDNTRKISWVICGGETGPKARPMKREWAEDLLDQCQAAGIPFFYKQGLGDDGEFCEMPVLRGQYWDSIPKERK